MSTIFKYTKKDYASVCSVSVEINDDCENNVICKHEIFGDKIYSLEPEVIEKVKKRIEKYEQVLEVSYKDKLFLIDQLVNDGIKNIFYYSLEGRSNEITVYNLHWYKKHLNPLGKDVYRLYSSIKRLLSENNVDTDYLKLK